MGRTSSELTPGASEHANGPRAAAFWFMAAAPMAATIGYLAEAAERAGDRRALSATGAAVSVAGAAVMPRSGFWGGAAVGIWLLGRRTAR